MPSIHAMHIYKKRFGDVKSYKDWWNSTLVENTLELLDEELPRFKSKIQMLHLCFTTDPFMYQYKEVQDMSLAAIKKINAALCQMLCINKRSSAD